MSEQKSEYYKIYEELIGFVPPRIKARIEVGSQIDPDLLDKVEEIRKLTMYPAALDTKTAQLILFALLLSHVAPAAEYHARGAMRAGATPQEMHAAAGLAFLFRGMPAFNLAGEILQKLLNDPHLYAGVETPPLGKA
jgi:alkylhydroperoxidase/carboxymuconolactone decarboxylase family protein YurZ